MSEYLLLLYTEETDEAGMAERLSEMPVWNELNASLQEAGLLVSNNALHPVDTATTVRVRNGETEITDGPFAVTKEVLAGYYLLDCSDIDEALAQAARLPLARYGSVEVRLVRYFEVDATPDQADAQG